MAQLSWQWLEVFARKTQISANFPAEPWSQSSAWGEFAAIYEAFYRGAVCCAHGCAGSTQGHSQEQRKTVTGRKTQLAGEELPVLQRGCGKPGPLPAGTSWGFSSRSGGRAGRAGQGGPRLPRAGPAAPRSALLLAARPAGRGRPQRRHA